MKKKKLFGFAKKIRHHLMDPAIGFSGLIEHLAHHAHDLGKEALNDGWEATSKDYFNLRDHLDSLSLRAKKKGL